MKIRIKFVKEDMWIGFYWKTIKLGVESWTRPISRLTRIYICIAPCFPIIIELEREGEFSKRHKRRKKRRRK